MFGLPLVYDVSEYTIVDQRIQSPLNIMILSDFHDDGFMVDTLIQKVHALNPDLILMPGDMFDIGRREKNTYYLLDHLKQYPLVFSSGNHEESRSDLPTLKLEVRKRGIFLPEEKSLVFQFQDTSLEILSICAHRKQKHINYAKVNEKLHTRHYRIVLSHRPHWVQLYQKLDCDLIVSGHAHGGQWRIPTTQQGIFSPQQGFFPKYTSGIHTLGRQKLLISRGLVHQYHGILRWFNNPEIVMLHLKKEL